MRAIKLNKQKRVLVNVEANMTIFPARPATVILLPAILQIEADLTETITELHPLAQSPATSLAFRNLAPTTNPYLHVNVPAKRVSALRANAKTIINRSLVSQAIH
jgi:hypothetical protein